MFSTQNGINLPILIFRAVQNTTKIVKMTKCETKQNQYILGMNESRKLIPLKMTKNQCMYYTMYLYSLLSTPVVLIFYIYISFFL